MNRYKLTTTFQIKILVQNEPPFFLEKIPKIVHLSLNETKMVVLPPMADKEGH